MVRAAWRRVAWLVGLCALAAAGAGLAQAVATKGPAAVDQQRFTEADKEPGQWMGIGRDWTYLGVYRSLDEELAAIDAVDQNSIRELLQRYPLDNLTTVALGPLAKLE